MWAGSRTTGRPGRCRRADGSDGKASQACLRRAYAADFETAAQAMHELVAELFPICRSITGDGVRETPGSSSGTSL